jgi:membrane associated rhomboid family serine protease
MVIPLGTDRDGSRPAVAVSLLIGANVLVYLLMRNGVARLWMGDEGGSSIAAFIEATAFTPGDLRWWQWITSLFVHSPTTLLHLVGNMIFLWAFGKPLESHVGFWRFLALYFLGGIAACAAHWLVSSSPAIGASGAVSAVAGFFICFFPRSRTRCFFLIPLGFAVVSSMWLIGLFAAIDVLRFLMDITGALDTRVAVGAHLGGLVFGVVGGLVLLRLGVVRRTDWDLLASLKQWNRRREMRSAMRGATVNPWTSGGPVGSIAAQGDGGRLDPAAEREAHLRASIAARLRERDSNGALVAYRALRAHAPTAMLGSAAQLEIANAALAAGDAQLAASAYAGLLEHYPSDAKATEVRLLLALVLVRRLGRGREALPLLEGLEDRIVDPGQRALVEALRAEARP